MVRLQPGVFGSYGVNWRAFQSVELAVRVQFSLVPFWVHSVAWFSTGALDASNLGSNPSEPIFLLFLNCIGGGDYRDHKQENKK